MFIRVFIDLTEGHNDFDPSSIGISIKDITNDSFVVAEWTDPTRTATGNYEYRFML